MGIRLILVLCLLVLLSCASAVESRFLDCKKPANDADRLTCDSPELMSAYKQFEDSYLKALAAPNMPNKKGIVDGARVRFDKLRLFYYENSGGASKDKILLGQYQNYKNDFYMAMRYDWRPPFHVAGILDESYAAMCNLLAESLNSSGYSASMAVNSDSFFPKFGSSSDFYIPAWKKATTEDLYVNAPFDIGKHFSSLDSYREYFNCCGNSAEITKVPVGERLVTYVRVSNSSSGRSSVWAAGGGYVDAPSGEIFLYRNKPFIANWSNTQPHLSIDAFDESGKSRAFDYPVCRVETKNKNKNGLGAEK